MVLWVFATYIRPTPSQILTHPQSSVLKRERYICEKTNPYQLSHFPGDEFSRLTSRQSLQSALAHTAIDTIR